jgi:hypothetical protein
MFATHSATTHTFLVVFMSSESSSDNIYIEERMLLVIRFHPHTSMDKLSQTFMQIYGPDMLRERIEELVQLGVNIDVSFGNPGITLANYAKKLYEQGASG